jgi:hypothetical protein
LTIKKFPAGPIIYPEKTLDGRTTSMAHTLTKTAIIMSLFIAATPVAGQVPKTHRALPYILEKLRSHQIVLMGTIHQQPQILELAAQVLPQIAAAGVTHLAVEVSRDQQGNIDRFIQHGTGLMEIGLHPSIDCTQYRRLFTIVRNLPPDQRPHIVAIDLPPSQYSGPVGRDAYMADALSDMFQSRTDGKVLVILGGLHVLKKLDWLPRITDRQPSIRSLLEERLPALKIFSMVHLVGDGKDNSNDIRSLVNPEQGAAAMDLDGRMAGWRLGLTDCLAVKPSHAHELVDGVIVH